MSFGLRGAYGAFYIARSNNGKGFSDLFSDKHKAFEAAYTHFENNPFSALIGGKR